VGYWVDVSGVKVRRSWGEIRGGLGLNLGFIMEILGDTSRYDIASKAIN